MLKFPGYRLRNPDRSDSRPDYLTGHPVFLADHVSLHSPRKDLQAIRCHRLPCASTTNVLTACRFLLLTKQNIKQRLISINSAVKKYIHNITNLLIIYRIILTLFVIFSFFKIIEIDTMHMYQNLPYF